jgi:chemotaxis protein CheD
MSYDSTPDPILRARLAAAHQRLKGRRGQADVLEGVCEIVSQLVGCEEYVLLALEPGGMRFSLVAAMGIELERIEALQVPQGILGQVARHGVRYIAGRTSAAGASSTEAGLTACIPLVENNRVGGVLAIFRLLPQKRGLTEEDVELLELLSEHGGGALRERRTGAVLLPPPVTASSSTGDSSGLRTLYLEPGGLFATGHPTEVTTILGSCVSTCLWDEHRRLGGINHFLLPTSVPGQPASSRHGDAAIPMLLREMTRLGSQREHLRAKVFGGASMNGGPQAGSVASLGQRNAELARRLLLEAGIPIVAEDLGGTAGRKLRFRTDDGSVLIKTLGGGG